jgi:6-phosphofructo-2-kinase/fructose-2,6-biphosphatase 4
VPEDYFFPDASPASVMLRQKILKKCREDIYAWLNHENGQVAIYDAVNPTAAGRRSLAKEFARHDVQVSCHTKGRFITDADYESDSFPGVVRQ